MSITKVYACLHQGITGCASTITSEGTIASTTSAGPSTITGASAGTPTHYHKTRHMTKQTQPIPVTITGVSPTH